VRVMNVYVILKKKEREEGF